MTKDFADIDWTAAKAENARLRERERALIDELAEANAAHDDAETRVDAALLDLRIANEALATFNARVLGLEAELAEARRDAAASLSQRADLVEELAEAKVDKDEANDHIIACQEFLVKNGTQPGGDGSVVVGMVTLVERCDEQRERAETLEAKLAGALDARDEAVAALANARASALEEAARALSRAAIKDAGVLWSIQTVRALAAKPTSVVCVPVDVLAERVKAGHNDTCGAVLSTEPYPCSCGHAALAALNAEKQR